MYSHEIINFVKDRNYTISIKDLNFLMGDSYAYYDILSQNDEVVWVRIMFDDAPSIDVNVIR